MSDKHEKQVPGEDLLQRWSRRKIMTQSAEAVDVAADLALVQPMTAQHQANKTDADMLPLEQLTEDSDYSDFLCSGVSDALRKLALRKLFHMPVMNVVDGLDDYAEDYTNFAPLGDIVPHEMKRMLEREKAKQLAEAEQLAQATDDDVVEPPPVDEQLAPVDQNQQVSDEPEQLEMIPDAELAQTKHKVKNEQHD
ncbi:MAG: DUF3306 domain-containing protein [Gammaproteobacteria bacterium]